MPIRQDQVMMPLVSAGLAAACAAGLVWAANALEGKWLIALVGGLSLLWLAIASGRFERVLLGLLILSIPFDVDVQLFAASTPIGAQDLRISAMDLILCMLYPLWIARLLAQRRSLASLWPPGATALVCLMGWGALSMVNAVDLQLSAFLLVRLGAAFLCYLYIANHMQTRDDLWLVARCLIAGLFFESLLACAQYVTDSTLGLEALGETRKLVTIDVGPSEFSRVTGTLGHPNPLGRYLASLLPLTLVLNLAALKWRWPTRLAMLVTSFLGTAALVCTLSRGAWLAAAVASLALGGWLVFQRRLRVQFMPLLLTTLALGVVLAFFGPLILARWIEYDQGTAASRLPLMRVAWAVITSHPLLGVGLNNYASVMHLYDPTHEGIAFRYQHGVHNAYLSLAAEVGLMGLVWLTWFVWAVMRRGWQKLAATEDDRTHLILLGIAAGLVALMVQGLVEPRYLTRDTHFLIFAALLVSRGPAKGHDEHVA